MLHLEKNTSKVPVTKSRAEMLIRNTLGAHDAIMRIRNNDSYCNMQFMAVLPREVRKPGLTVSFLKCNLFCQWVKFLANN